MKNKLFICTITPKLVEKTIWHAGEPESNDQRRAATKDWSETSTVRVGSAVECREVEIDPQYLAEFKEEVKNIEEQFSSKLGKFYWGLELDEEVQKLWISRDISFYPVVKAGGLSASFDVDSDPEFEEYFNSNFRVGIPCRTEFCFIVHYGIKGQYVTKVREHMFCKIDGEYYEFTSDMQNEETHPALCIAEELCEMMGMNIDQRYSHLL